MRYMFRRPSFSYVHATDKTVSPFYNGVKPLIILTNLKTFLASMTCCGPLFFYHGSPSWHASFFSLFSCQPAKGASLSLVPFGCSWQLLLLVLELHIVGCHSSPRNHMLWLLCILGLCLFLFVLISVLINEMLENKACHIHYRNFNAWCTDIVMWQLIIFKKTHVMKGITTGRCICYW